MKVQTTVPTGVTNVTQAAVHKAAKTQTKWGKKSSTHSAGSSGVGRTGSIGRSDLSSHPPRSNSEGRSSRSPKARVRPDLPTRIKKGDKSLISLTNPFSLLSDEGGESEMDESNRFYPASEGGGGSGTE